jgi:GTPase
MLLDTPASFVNNIAIESILGKIQYPLPDDCIIKYNITLPTQPKEKYYGNREYKRHLIINESCIANEKRILQKRGTQLLFRINEGQGKAVYLIGVDDNGKTHGLTKDECVESINNFIRITKSTSVKIKKIRIYMWKDEHQHERYCVIFKVLKPIDTNCLFT